MSRQNAFSILKYLLFDKILKSISRVFCVPLPKKRDMVAGVFGFALVLQCGAGVACGSDGREAVCNQRWRVICPETTAITWELRRPLQASEGLLVLEQKGKSSTLPVFMPEGLPNYIAVHPPRAVRGDIYRDNNVYYVDDKICIMSNEWFMNARDFTEWGDLLIDRPFPLVYCVKEEPLRLFRSTAVQVQDAGELLVLKHQHAAG